MLLARAMDSEAGSPDPVRTQHHLAETSFVQETGHRLEADGLHDTD